jgi:hypothetical protein
MDIKVSDPYPCWISIQHDGGELRLSHKELLALEHAVAEAKRQCLCKLNPYQWHEIDPKLAEAK